MQGQGRGRGAARRGLQPARRLRGFTGRRTAVGYWVETPPLQQLPLLLLLLLSIRRPLLPREPRVPQPGALAQARALLPCHTPWTQQPQQRITRTRLLQASHRKVLKAGFVATINSGVHISTFFSTVFLSRSL